jgi:hypothetical protein
MPSDLQKARDWMAANSGHIDAAFDGAMEMLALMRPKAAASNTTIKDLFTGDPMADRRIADAVGLASIAGRHNVSPDVIMGAVNTLLKIATAVVAFV